MTDAELIDLAHAKEPEDFTAAEIERLRQAARRSPAVRASVAARIRTEEYLATALGRPELGVDLILARQEKTTARRSALTWRWGVVTIAVVLGLATAVGGWKSLRPRMVSQATVASQLPQARPDEPAAIAVPLPADDPQEPLRRDVPDGPASIPPPEGPADSAGDNPGPAAAVVAAPGDAPSDPLPAITPAEAAALRYARPGPADKAPSRADLERWFSPVDGRPLAFGEQTIDGRRLGTLDGVGRLARPLAGQSLRLALHEPAGLRLHCWSGDRGVTLVLNAKGGPWWAYATTRVGGGPLPATFALAARDGWRLGRAPATAGPVQVLELRQQADRLLVSTGDVTILDAACPGPIDEIVCEGKATLRQIDLLPPLDLPPVVAAAGDKDVAPAPEGGNLAGVGPATRDERLPAGEEWGSQSLPAGSRLVLDDDGGIELSVDSPPQPAWAMIRLPDRGGWMWTFDLAAADPGTGLCLGDAAGNPVRVVRLMRGKGWEGARLCELVAAGDQRGEADADPYERPQAFIAGPFQIRLLSSGGMLRCWIAAAGSDDWVEAFDPVMEGGPQAIWVGLHAAAGQGARSIRLARCVGTLPAALASLGGSAGEDLALVGAACPKAEALAAFARLGAAVAAVDRPLPDRLAMLREIAVRAPVWGDPEAAGRIARLYETTGLAVADAGMPAAYSALAVEQQTAPLAIAQPYDWFPATLARRELLDLVGGRSWADAARLAERVRFFGFAAPPLEPLTTWAVAAGQRLSAPRAMSQAGLLPARGVAATWLHPLVIEVSKDAFNFHADFEAASAAGAWPDAAAMLAAAGPALRGSLVPDASDPDLAMRLDVAGDVAVAGLPGFQDAMRASTEASGLVRFRMFAERGDASGVEGVAAGFPGTQAAAEAEGWLAARALAVGRFQAARRHVARGLPWSSAEAADRLAAVATLLVEPGAAAPAGPVGSLSADGLKATLVGRLEGDVGANPGGLPGEYRSGWPGVAAGSIDWAGRQAAVTAAGSDLFVSNRFQLACFSSGVPQPRWRVGLGPAAGDTHAWTGQPMRPVVAEGTVFVRLLEKSGPRLAAVAVGDGGERWMLPSTETRQFVSDPLLSGDAVFIVAATKGDRTWQLSLQRIHPADGTSRWERPLVTLRESWWPSRDCQIAAADDGTIVIACGGSLVACDDEGSVRWLRRLPWVPAAADPLRLEQEQSPPVIAGQAVYALLPGVPGLVAVERSTGRRLWSAPLATARRIVAVDQSGDGAVLAVATSDGLVGLRGSDGSVAWHLATEGLLDGSCAAAVVAGRVAIVGFAAGTAAADGRREPVMLCIAAGTGEVLGRQAFADLADPAPRIAPVLPGPGELRVLFGRGPNDPNRDLVVFAP